MSARTLLFLSATMILCGCNCTPNEKPDAGPGDASVNEGGNDEFDAGFDGGEIPVDGGQDAGPPPELKVTRLLPPRGGTAGGTATLLEGSGFLRNFAPSGTQAKALTTLRIGGNEVQDFQIIDDETIELRTPPGTVGKASVALRNPNGNFICNNCFTYFDDLVVTDFSPREGPLAGGNEVTLTGEGFTSDTQVLFGALSSPRITVVASTQLKVVAPRGQAAEVVDLLVYNKNGTSSQRRSYTYLPELRVASLSPVVGITTGGTSVSLKGTGLGKTTAVQFGAAQAVSFVVVSDDEVTAVTPPALAGAVDVTVMSPQGSWATKSGFTYFDASGAFAIWALSPRLITAGQTVLLTGQGLDQGSLSVSIGGVSATVGARTFSTAELLIPTRGAAPRVSDVEVTGTSTLTLTGGAKWKVSLSAATPASGPAVGGTAVTVSGEALPPGVDVTVGTFAASSLNIVSETTLELTTPAGSGGAASEVHLTETGDLENDATLAGGFTFSESLSLGRVQPERGAISGGTLVTVLGSGFGDATVVKFGAFTAKDFKLVDSHTVTCRTPKGAVGVVDVKVERQGQSDVLPGGFSYFDPRSISGGLSGGPLVGTLNITVLDSSDGLYGVPVKDAQVMLGLDSATPFQGVTDLRGQITFSDPSLVKTQTVTVFKDTYESATVTGVNAENLTVFIARTGGGEPSPDNNVPPGSPPSTISGRVTGFKTPRPLVLGETLEARVFVAQTSLFAGPPFGGPPDRSSETWRVVKDGGDYFVYTGAGLRAVYAILGIVDSKARFSPLAMGIKRGVTTSPESPAVDKDIVIDMKLDLEVPVLIDSPLVFEDQNGDMSPGLNSVYAWLELGAEGFIPNPYNWAAGTSGTTSMQSTGPHFRLPGFPQLDGTNFIFLNRASAQTTMYPVSCYFRRQAGNLSDGVTIGPMLPAPHLLQPLTTFDGTASWTMAPGPAPDLHQVQILRPSFFGNTVVWSMILPGAETQVVVPQIALEKLRREEKGNELMLFIASSRTPKFSYNQWTYETLSPVTWSSFTLVLSEAFTP